MKFLSCILNLLVAQGGTIQLAPAEVLCDRTLPAHWQLKPCTLVSPNTAMVLS